MKSETTFNNFWFPKLKQTTGPEVMDQKKLKSNSIIAYIDQKMSIKKNHPICHIGSNTYFSNDQFEVYELPSSLSILTYNIWFEQHNKSTRFQCIIKILACSNADFICLQEVTQQFMQLIFNQPKDSWVNHYFVSIFPMGWYDTLILTKYKCRFYKIPFEVTGQGRSMLFAELVESQGQNIIVGSMHYESLGGNQKVRQQQLKAVQKITEVCQRTIIVGDYNFSDFAGENKAIDKSYTDIWLKVHKIGQNGHTMEKTPQYSSWRPDHILFKAPSTVDLSCAQIYKIGQFSIPPYEKEDYKKVALDAVIRTPSDHYGLVCWLPMI